MARTPRIAAIVAAAASLFLAVVAALDLGAPPEGGHWASMAACAIAAENMLRYHVLGPVIHYAASPPPDPTQYYCRHPYAIYLMVAVAQALFGHTSWAMRVPAIVCSGATPFVIYRLGLALWGPVPAAVAAVAFVVVPIDLAFACFSSLEVPTILFGLVFCLGSVRVWQGSRRTRDVIIAAGGALGACHSDWIGALFVGLVLGFGVVRAYAMPRAWRGSIHPRTHALWFASTIAIALGTLLLYAVHIVHSGQVQDVLYGAKYRMSGRDLPLRSVFTPERLARLQWMLPSVGLAVLAVALPISVVRARKNAGEILLVAWTAMATVQYLVFKEGADVHIFWPHYYGACIALAFGTIASALLSWAASSRAATVRARWRVAGAVVLVAFVALPMAMLARVGAVMLEQSRTTQGRFEEHGYYIESGAAASQFAAWATRDLPRTSLVRCTHLCSENVEYATGLPQIHGSVDRLPGTESDRDRIELVDARYTSFKDLRALASAFDTVAVGPFLRVDRAVAGNGIRAIRYTERQPALAERILVTDHDQVRTIGDEVDPWATWEWARALGTEPPPAPTAEPTNLDELAVAYAIAQSTGDAERAGNLRQRALAWVGDTGATEFTDDVRLLATRVERGAAIVVTLLWETGLKFRAPAGSTFVVRCKVEAAPPLWPVPIDPFEKYAAPPMTLPPPLWNPGELHVQRFVLLHRPGRENCRGFFAPTTTPVAVRPRSGPLDVDLLTIE